MPRTSTAELGGSEAPSLPKVGVSIGTWNVSGWSSHRLAPISSLGTTLFAVQETKLSSLFVGKVCSSLKCTGFTLHHGWAVPARRVGGHGASCGVGVLAGDGVAVSPLPPEGPAWKRLFAMSRVHGVFVRPRPSLPQGLRVFSIYAPLQRDATREAFNLAFIDLVASLDMQLPTLFMGDFNGTIAPERDYSSGEGPVCPLLSRLLGPGGPLLDLQLVVSP